MMSVGMCFVRHRKSCFQLNEQTDRMPFRTYHSPDMQDEQGSSCRATSRVRFKEPCCRLDVFPPTCDEWQSQISGA